MIPGDKRLYVFFIFICHLDGRAILYTGNRRYRNTIDTERTRATTYAIYAAHNESNLGHHITFEVIHAVIQVHTYFALFILHVLAKNVNAGTMGLNGNGPCQVICVRSGIQITNPQS